MCVALLVDVRVPLTDAVSRVAAAGRELHGSVQVVAGIALMGCVFVVAESLAFLDEHVRGT